VESVEAIFVLDVDPCFELILKGRVIAVVFKILSREGFKMQYIDFEFG